MSSTPGTSTRKPYPHFDDLVEEININPQKHVSIKRWLEEAQSHLRSAEFQGQNHRADNAYLDLMRVAEIITNVIPANMEFPTFKSNPANATNKEYQRLQNRLDTILNKAFIFRNEIKEDNKKHGTQRKQHAQRQTQSSTPGSLVNGTIDASKHNTTTYPQKRPPPVPAKPPAFSGQDGKPNGYAQKSVSKPINSNNNIPSADELNARFERLRSSSSMSRQFPDTNSTSSPQSSISSPIGANSVPRGRPPRLDTSVITGLPRPPSPTYSPARNSISPARSIPRKPIPAPPMVNLTNEPTLSPTALSTYISRSTEISLLVLDVRERTEYDEGHIPAKAIICIEPLQLRREGTTGQELEDLISLSPSPKEHQLFSKRHTFDLVVYHDQSTASDAFLNQRASNQSLIVLQRLHQALSDLSYEKPLKRPPVLLAGGLKAWTDLFGPSSLVIDDSCPKSPPSYKSPAVGLGISSLSRGTPPLPDKIDQRNRKEPPVGDSLDIDIAEEQAWLKKLQQDREPLTISVPMDAGNMDVKRQRRSTSIVAASEPYPRTIEQFFQQFPASPSIHQQSMMSPIPGTPAVATPLTPGFQSKRYTIIDHPFYGFTDVRNPEFHPPPSPVRPPPALPRTSYKGESEKPPVRPIEPPALVKESSMVGLTQHHPTTSGSPNNFGTVGLQNVQNCCYMNAVIQCFNGSIPLARYFLDGSYKMHINKANKLGTKGELVEMFAVLVKNLWEGKYKFISPRSFKDLCGRINEFFSGSEQNDASEFLAFLMDKIHEDLNPNASRGKLKDLTEEQEMNRESLPVPHAASLEWQRYMHNNYSVVTNWFQGQYYSRLTCTGCKFHSTTFTPFSHVQIPIAPGPNPTLYECLDLFCREEKLGEDENWKCPRCEERHPTTKKMGFSRLPHMLVISFNRFRTINTDTALGSMKVGTPVKFPLRKLKLDEYVTYMGDGKLGGPPGTIAPFQPTPEQTAPFVYDLYGLVKHVGNLWSGHYTATVRDAWANVWKDFDDTRMRKAEDADLLSLETQQKAYITFWVRGNIM